MTGRACQTVRQTWPCFAALDRSRLLRPDTSPPWNSPPASPRSFSTSTGPDFGLTGPSRHDPPDMHRLRLRPVPLPGLHEEILSQEDLAQAFFATSAPSAVVARTANFVPIEGIAL